MTVNKRELSNVYVSSSGSVSNTLVWVGGVRVVGVTKLDIKKVYSSEALLTVNLTIAGVGLGKPESLSEKSSDSSKVIPPMCLLDTKNYLTEADYNHLIFIYGRMANVHGEKISVDYMWKFKQILQILKPKQTTIDLRTSEDV